MPMPAPEIEKIIKAALPDATVELTALANDNDHWAAKQHQLVNAAFGGRLGTELHALSLTTRAP